MNKERASQLIAYTHRRISFLLKRKYCEVESPNHSSNAKKATDVHHMRGRYGDNLLNEEEWLPCCRKCHDFIEDHPDWARAKGYTLSRLETNG